MSRFVRNGLRALAVLAMLATSSQVLAVDIATYSKPGSVTKKLFRLSGEFGNCGGAGNPDTELRTFSESALIGGLTREVQFRSPYVGGVNGTLCMSFKTVFIKSAAGRILVQNIRYDALGNVTWSIATDFDPVDCDDCGIVLGHNNMQTGIDWTSGALTYEKISGTPGFVTSKMVMTDFGFSEIVAEGTAQEESFSNCLETWEDRRSAGQFGHRSVLRVACENIGMILSAQVDNQNGATEERLWQLIWHN